MMTRSLQLCLLLISLVFSVPLNGQNELLTDVNYQKQKGSLRAVSLFSVTTSANRPDYSSFTNEMVYLTIEPTAIQNLYLAKNDGLLLTIPGFNNQSIIVALARQEIFSSNFAVYENHGDRIEEVTIPNHSLYYRGIVQGDPNSLVSLSVHANQLTAIISTDLDGDITLALDVNDPGLLKNNYLLFRERDRFETSEFKCTSSVLMDIEGLGIEAATNRSVYNTCKELEIQFTASNRTYTHFGSNPTTVTNYIEDLTYHVATVFRKENIYISIGSIIINTSADTYTESDSWALLQDFGNAIGPTWNAGTSELAHLVDIASGLGGIAWLDVLCFNAYYDNTNVTWVGPFAYSDVDGMAPAVPGGLPNWNWDIEVFSHEMGHNIGSPHTQSCTWPGGAIDNCVPVEDGSCSPGPPPAPGQGTIMSYCHTTPVGINLNQGFGPLPGNLIRSKVAAAGCPSNYIPDDIFATTTTNAGTTIVANRECTNGSWTHYYNDNGTVNETDDIWLLSIDKAGQNIGSIGSGAFAVTVGLSNGAASTGGATQITAPYVTNPMGWYVMNRYWIVTPTSQPTSNVTIRFPYSGQDLADVVVDVPAATHTNLHFYKLDGAINPNPNNNHAGATSADYNEYTNGPSPSLSTWVYSTDAGGNHIATFQVSSFSGGGGGAGGGGNGALPVELISFSGKLSGNSINLFWETASEENNDFFTVERSADARRFEAIGKVKGNGTTSQTQQYSLSDNQPHTGTNYYRLIQTDLDGTQHKAGGIVAIDFRKDISIAVRPNPVKGDVLHLYFTTTKPGELSVEIMDINGTIQYNTLLDSDKGDNVFDLNLPDLANGVYIVRTFQGHTMETIRFVKTN